MQTVALRERPDMSDGIKIKRAKHVSKRLLHLFQCLQFNIQKSGNAIPNSYHFCVMGSIAEVENRVVSLKINFSWTRVC